MNQKPRYVRMTCIVCKENTVKVEQIYNPRISNWEAYGMPICNECRKRLNKEEILENENS